MGNAASALPFVVGEEVASYPESHESTYWRLHRGTKRVSTSPACPLVSCYVSIVLDHPILKSTTRDMMSNVM